MEFEFVSSTSVPFILTFFPSLKSHSIKIILFNVLDFMNALNYIFSDFLFTVAPNTFYADKKVVVFMRLNCKRCAKNMRFGPAIEIQYEIQEPNVDWV